MFSILLIPVVFAASWFYPMDQIDKRQTVKGFGQYIDNDNNFYKGKESLFPYNRFYGFHTGVDLEALPSEQKDEIKVPVFAVSNGTIVYIGNLEGYGGVILEKFDSENLSAGRQDLTALYGHVKTNTAYKVGDHINARDILTYLGNAFSNETSLERKHLHFGIYKGSDLYFHGHEQTLEQLNQRWIDPLKFLKEKGADELRAERTDKRGMIKGEPRSLWGFFRDFILSVLRGFHF